MPQEPGARPRPADGVRVLNPRARVPLSFIIDDSTCLVNLAHFCIPQFAEVFPENYTQDWRSLPREIPDSFVRTFGEWCHEHGVKGKYSIVPYPACVGWIDREMPGWSRKELEESIDLVRTLMLPNWDIHPEMISHTWVINTKTGRPYEERTENYMENWGWSVGRSVDELADYLSYALRLLKNAGLPCEGVTTPGGFGSRALPQLAQATLESVRDVFGAEIPHYFRHLYTDDRSVAPRVEFASGLDGDDPRCVVSIIGCTGDWFGGWDGLTPGSVDQFITEDLKGGRLPEVIARGEPAILVCHWPGIYYNGEQIGFSIFKEVVARLEAGYDNLLWMKNSEIARYWAARELTAIEAGPTGVCFLAPYACPSFTVAIDGQRAGAPAFDRGGGAEPLREVAGPLRLESGTWCRADGGVIVCIDLPHGRSAVSWRAGA
ncbi:hypothetical protein TsocGM_23300 [Tautonia sociabilis]|uniref:Uncharacterized protein n=2 Tax=Tautonia sociabilis TaxID=2080755 RepID=A0A432MDI8_9BACT|nr:hypothetical protein TsocGM_23300 [Tautonia sociabilis]